MPCWYPAGDWPALTLCEPPHSLLDLLGAPTVDNDHTAVGARLFLIGLLPLCLLPALLLVLLLLLHLLLRLLLPPEAAL